MRRGIYTGVYTSWHSAEGYYPPRPALYFVINRPDTGMVRIEAGLGGRTLWIDWGRGSS